MIKRVKEKDVDIYLKKIKDEMYDDWVDQAIDILLNNYVSNLYANLNDDEYSNFCDNIHKYFDIKMFKKNILTYVRNYSGELDLDLCTFTNKIQKEIWEKYKIKNIKI